MNQQTSQFVSGDSVHEHCTAAIDASIERVIGEKLRRAFAHIIDEPIPDRFFELLDNLARDEEAR